MRLEVCDGGAEAGDQTTDSWAEAKAKGECEAEEEKERGENEEGSSAATEETRGRNPWKELNEEEWAGFIVVGAHSSLVRGSSTCPRCGN